MKQERNKNGKNSRSVNILMTMGNKQLGWDQSQFRPMCSCFRSKSKMNGCRGGSSCNTAGLRRHVIAWLANHAWKSHSTELGREPGHMRPQSACTLQPRGRERHNRAKKKHQPHFWLDVAAFQGRNCTGYALYLEMTLNLELFEGWTGLSRERERERLAESCLNVFCKHVRHLLGLYHSVLKERLFWALLVV